MLPAAVSCQTGPPSQVQPDFRRIMRTVDIHEATTLLSSLVDVIERGVEREVIIARNGRPAARLVAIATVPQGRRLGVAKGRFEVPAGIDRSNDKVGRRFRGT